MRQGTADGRQAQGLLGQPGPAGSSNGRLNGPLAAIGERDRAGGTIIRQKNSALPDPNPSGAIAAIEADNLTAFARDLRAMRTKAELDYPEMAERSHYTMRTLVSAAGGLRLPTLPVLVAYVQACGGNVEEWEERWGRIAKTLKKEERAALPAAGSTATDDGPAEFPATAKPQLPEPQEDDGAVYVITSAKSREEYW
jgi:hypothetical protein